MGVWGWGARRTLKAGEQKTEDRMAERGLQPAFMGNHEGAKTPRPFIAAGFFYHGWPDPNPWNSGRKIRS
jgi:hypothetical protein